LVALAVNRRQRAVPVPAPALDRPEQLALMRHWLSS
jgi:hypothetical protein